MDVKYHTYATLPENLTVEEVADFARVTQQSVYRWIEQGLLPSIRFGTRVRVAKSDLYDFIVSSGAR